MPDNGEDADARARRELEQFEGTAEALLQQEARHRRELDDVIPFGDTVPAGPRESMPVEGPELWCGQHTKEASELCNRCCPELWCGQHTKEASELCNRCYQASRAQGITFSEYFGRVAAQALEAARCKHAVASVVRVSSAVEWCGECGAYRLEDAWIQPIRSAAR